MITDLLWIIDLFVTVQMWLWPEIALGLSAAICVGIWLVGVVGAIWGYIDDEEWSEPWGIEVEAYIFGGFFAAVATGVLCLAWPFIVTGFFLWLPLWGLRWLRRLGKMVKNHRHGKNGEVVT